MTRILRPLLSSTRALARTPSPLASTSTIVRNLASPSTPKALYTPVLPPHDPAALHLKSGQTYEGQAFGAKRSVFGETVFSTSITSCKQASRYGFSVESRVSLNGRPDLVDTESMTDPSYLGQILVFTSPLIGNYGVPKNLARSNEPGIPILESTAIQCTGVVVSDVATKYSHHAAIEGLHEWCARHNVPGISGVDTRAITTLLRDQGTTLGRLAIGAEDVAQPRPKDAEYWDPSKDNLIAQASTKEVYTLNPEGDVNIALLDFGAKANIVRSLVRRNARVTVLPWDFDFNTVRDQYDGLFLSNGPGDPKSIMDTAMRVRKTVEEWDKPIFGICMGHQILGLAAGLEAYRMTFGNRGHNQPVLALANSGSIKAGRVYVTVSREQSWRS